MSLPARTPAAFVAAAVAVGVLALPAGGARKADVTLQVVPRGPGVVTSDPATGGRTCAANQEPNDCVWTFPSGATITLSPKPVAGTSWRWSIPGCATSADCRLRLDGDTTVAVLFGRLTLSVDTSGKGSGDRITSTPPGIDCGDTCAATFDVGTTVTLTVEGAGFTSFPYGCTTVSGRTCTVTVLDDPQSVGVKFNNAEGPVAPPVVEVRMRVEKGGAGGGRVSAGALDCGGVCTASYPYGDLATFVARANAGSHFDGWGGICADDRAPTCRLPVGPITLVRPSFARDAVPLAVTLVAHPVVRGGPPRVVARVRTSAAARGSAAVLVRGKAVATRQLTLRAGVNTITVRVARGAWRPGARLRLRLADRTYSWPIRATR